MICSHVSWAVLSLEHLPISGRFGFVAVYKPSVKKSRAGFSTDVVRHKMNWALLKSVQVPSSKMFQVSHFGVPFFTYGLAATDTMPLEVDSAVSRTDMSCWALPADIYSGPFSFFVVATATVATATVATCPGDVWSPYPSGAMWFCLKIGHAQTLWFIIFQKCHPFGGVAHFADVQAHTVFRVSRWDLWGKHQNSLANGH